MGAICKNRGQRGLLDHAVIAGLGGFKWDGECLEYEGERFKFLRKFFRKRELMRATLV